MVFVLIDLDVDRVAASFRWRTPARVVAALLGILAVSLAAMWIAGSVRFIATGEVPEEGSRLILPTALTHLAYVMDLALLVPAYALGAILLWRRKAWGFVLSTALLVSGAVHQLAYMAALVFQAKADIPGATPFDPIEPFIVTVYVVGVALLVTNIREPKAPAAPLR
jgi:hypothetical protein